VDEPGGPGYPESRPVPSVGGVNRSWAGGLLVVASATGYGLIPLFGTEAHRAGLGPVPVMAVRFALAAGALWTVVAVRRPPVASWRLVAGALALGAGCWSVQSVGYLTAVDRLGASAAALLLYTYPLIVVGVAVLAGRQRWHRTLALAAGLVLAGLGLVFGAGALGPAAPDPAGVAAGAVAALTYTAFILTSEPVARRLDPFLFTALAMTGAALATGAVCAAGGGVPVAPVLRAAGPLSALAVLSTVVPVVAFFAGLRRVGAATAAVLSCTEVVVAVAVAAAALGDRVTPLRATGCVAIVGAAALLAGRRG